ncbi:hypothetical protein K0M31_004386 [Melipona bicolor]|uniref:Uncharacterized protein n=1 Tax=Melipona bicolor TaxID=60889 RepID=A0AA40FWP6_9HYME|nr:hypothetical protein K0M31_004386 [Melipona bicolor]
MFSNVSLRPTWSGVGKLQKEKSVRSRDSLGSLVVTFVQRRIVLLEENGRSTCTDQQKTREKLATGIQPLISWEHLLSKHGAARSFVGWSLGIDSELSRLSGWSRKPLGITSYKPICLRAYPRSGSGFARWKMMVGRGRTFLPTRKPWTTFNAKFDATPYGHAVLSPSK